MEGNLNAMTEIPQTSNSLFGTPGNNSSLSKANLA
jgi:hypothetical protein